MAEQKSSNGGGGGGDVVINVPVEEASRRSKEMASPESEKGVPFSKSPSPEISKLVGSPNKPPRAPNQNNVGLTQRKSFARSVYSKPKSRFVDPSCPVDTSILEEEVREQLGAGFSFSRASPNNKSNRSVGSPAPVTPSKVVVEKDEDEEIYKKVKLNREMRSKISTLALIESAFFVVILSALVASLTINVLKHHTFWGLEVWKWCVLVMVIFSGMLVTNWFMRLIVFLIETNFLLRRKVLYFVHGLKKSVQVFIWLCLILVAWILLFNHDVKRSPAATKVLKCITRTLISILTGAFFWLVKTLLLKILAANFNVNNFFDRIQDSVFHQYVLQTLSGLPLMEEAERVGREPSTGHLSFATVVKKGTVKEKKVIDMGKVHKMKREKVSAWTMRVLMEAVRTSGLSTISDTLDETAYGEGKEQADREITSEMEALAAAYHVFRNVAQPFFNYIEEEDLLRFMIKEEVDLVFPLFDGAAETGRITRKAFTEWVVKVYTSRRALAHSLNDTKTAVKQLNKLVTAILMVVTVVIWLLLLEVATTKVLLFFSTQLVALAFIIVSTCKNLFESIVFVFVMHPYDVGDRCVVDGVAMLVEEMNLLTTVFLKLNNEKVYYPNAVLATKPISNYFRSPNMGETVEFSISFSTPVSKIAHLKERIAEYLEQNPQHWAPVHSVVVKEIENMNKLKMALYSDHTITFQENRERNLRRTELSLAIKRMLEDLHIDYTLLPQDINLTKKNSLEVLFQ
uniref:Mechanosensitive ion channel protein 10 n=1 Tax=Arabidopsis thaliana TaxID=3702 RepID=UPI00292A5E1F|nr:Chain A, Mechanosensitive ion channel protein 10 [Arabidopsis thaliana]8TDK_B Chain B, Mechanosensitive ion channel protein 10 [Arabidopsis thaliana]8TDK_C Chain C, Mechanosensitive ion channel protein 10 [Arabidopsis thaliana]8TDK_D Chain D, Mechanosensitive ion channel protein 10 [Arabidopsis thaliana]8TDK_E Chain E, Mechanosensitive ion channel protein 10 [Arabidopsis thaliana]8TDK_F Chain F, Mechanosensitive ion channel protein 10 [Arabidopsis thaliana]8TDK_G Chain G, Mechanosensitive 